MVSAKGAQFGHGQTGWADLDDKVRPVVVITRAHVADRLHNLLVAPVTSTICAIPTEVSRGPLNGVRRGSVPNLDNIQLIAPDRLLERVGSVAVGDWPKFCEAMQRVMGCPRI